MPIDNRQSAVDNSGARLLEARHRGLEHAAAARRADRSEFYAPSFVHGFDAFDLERSAAAAGEAPAQLRYLLALFDRVLLPLCGFLERFSRAALRCLPLKANTASPRPLKLVRALARLAWFHLRLLFTQARWERRAVCYRLQELAAWRRRRGPLTHKRLKRFQDDLELILGSHAFHDRNVDRLERRFNRLWHLLFEPPWANAAQHHPAAPEADAGQPHSLENASAAPGNGAPSLGGSPSGDGVSPAAAGNGGGFPGPGATTRQVREYEILLHLLARVDRYGPEEISNIVASPSHTRSRKRRRESPPAPVKPPEQWQSRTKPGQPDAESGPSGDAAPKKTRRDRSAQRQQAGEKAAFEFRERVTGDHDPPDAFLRRLEKRGQLRLPENFEGFLELVEQALGKGDLRSPSPRHSRAKPALSLSKGGNPRTRSRRRHSRERGNPAPSAHVATPESAAFCKRKEKPRTSNNEVRATSAHRHSREKPALSLSKGGNPRTPLPHRHSRAKLALNLSKGGNPASSGGAARPVASNTRRVGSGPRDGGQTPIENRPSTIVNPSSTVSAFASLLWLRLGVLSHRRTRLIALLAATLEWDPDRLVPLWDELLSPDAAFYAHGLLARAAKLGLKTHARAIAFRPARRRTPPPPDTHPRLLLDALQYWFGGFNHTSYCAFIDAHNAHVALWDLAVERFGVTRELLAWRPPLSGNQWDVRCERPEWQVRVTDVDGKEWVKLEDGQMFEPKDAKGSGSIT